MVKRLIIKLIIEVGSTFAKSFMKAYQQSAKQQGGKSANPFSEFLNQTMQAANLTHKPMTRDEAFKILQLTAEKTNAEEILKIYWRQFHKNDPVKGGSFYIQSMLHNAKCELMKDFPDINEKEILEKLRKEEESQKGKEEEGKQEEQKTN
ncbi:unnamed protein product (macronuclear) [Paramecium tetraurelia]|uniref:Mitochondrial import inner membrane translocase subunit TIM16 n=1 Tax=Paramecium tetraurelia TaxID=5888 RepID=A0DM53_PARTE|nr:uncharacterized protein GSPATT00018338001 [Paramecium tetraurelia]CAK84120.1 unnamed protein product [Paramecium tetraurelia]|eukprot:XP_001451517.1 hypothetical protein (macronuclear) [Paramecium tetraurelia strain d4-2]